jgi:hypothetical protein
MPRVGFEPTIPAFERTKTVHALSWVSIARQTRSFVYCVRVQHRSAADACGCRSTLFLSHKAISTERSQHTEIRSPRDKELLRFGATRAKFARVNVRSAPRCNMISTLRGKATNIASRDSRAPSIPGFRPRGHCDRQSS